MTQPLGSPRVHLRKTASTNAFARELVGSGAPHGTLVSATEQQEGRGRQGRSWAGAAGRSLLCSWVVRDPPPLLSLAAGVAVAETVDAVLAGIQAQIKWPNDVLLDGRKVAGILVEGRPQERWAVLGIGMNVAVRLQDLPPALSERAGTLGLDPADVERVMIRLQTALDRWLVASDSEVLDAVRSRDALLGQTINWEGGTGTAAGIDDSGRLLVDRDSNSDTATGTVRVALDAGEVHLGTNLSRS
jgi:BirA family transcriptional regulator, biotin operon repressor / biotin---[acetyl-CoA-carboxylase] ligase